MSVIIRTFGYVTAIKSIRKIYRTNPCIPLYVKKTFDVFPTLPIQQGTGRYKADSQSEKQKDQCRKESWGHPTLSPGIFTMYCQHGICYGFSILSDCESPKHPFEIFRQRFKVAPKIIIYVNACKLHQYCLLREPAFFKHTMFLVDIFH